MHLQALAKQYDEYVRLGSGLSRSTADSYRGDITKLLDQLQQLGVSEVGGLTRRHLQDVVARWHRKGLGARSIARMVSSMRGFCRWLVENNHLAENPVTKIKIPKAKKRLPETMTIDTVQHMLDALAADKNPSISKIRDIAMLELCYSSGMRLAELVGLDVLDLDLQQGVARVMGKRQKERDCPVGRRALLALKQWLHVRGQWYNPVALDQASSTTKKHVENPLFLGKSGKRIHPRVAQKAFAKRALEAGIEQHLHPHIFRHSFASHILESSHDLLAVQELLGHESISATQIYTHLDFQALADVYDTAHPRAKRQTGLLKRKKPQ